MEGHKEASEWTARENAVTARARVALFAAAESSSLRSETCGNLCVTAKVPYGLHKQTRGCRSVVEPGATSRVCLQPWAALPRSPGLEGTTPWPTAPSLPQPRPVSEAARLLRQRQKKWKRKVALSLLQTHLQRQLQQGRQGAFALASLAYLAVRILVGAIRQAVLQVATAPFRRRRGEEGGQVAAATD